MPIWPFYLFKDLLFNIISNKTSKKQVNIVKMKVVRYNLMIKKRDGTLFAIYDKEIAECVKLINDFVKNEYGIDIKITYTKLYDVLRNKTKNSFLNQIMQNIEKKQYNQEDLNNMRNSNEENNN